MKRTSDDHHRGHSPIAREPELLGQTGGRHGPPSRANRRGIISTVSVSTPTLIASLALGLAPIRVDLVAARFVDARLSASLLGDDLE